MHFQKVKLNYELHLKKKLPNKFLAIGGDFCDFSLFLVAVEKSRKLILMQCSRIWVAPNNQSTATQHFLQYGSLSSKYFSYF